MIPKVKQITALTEFPLSYIEIMIMSYGDWANKGELVNTEDATTKWKKLGDTKEGTTANFSIAETGEPIKTAESGDVPKWMILGNVAATAEAEIIEIDSVVRALLSNSLDANGNIINNIGKTMKEFSIRIHPKAMGTDYSEDLIIPRVSVGVTEGKENAANSAYSMKLAISAMWCEKVIADQETLVLYDLVV